MAKAFLELRLQALAAVLLVSFGLSNALAQDAPMEIAGATTLDSKGVIDLVSTTPGVAIVDNRTKADFDNAISKVQLIFSIPTWRRNRRFRAWSSRKQPRCFSIVTA
jgi:hypothetical protein